MRVDFNWARAEGSQSFVIAQVTFLNGIRQRLFSVGMLLAGALVAIVLGLRDFNFGGSETCFMIEFGLAAQGLGGTVLVMALVLQCFVAETGQGGSRAVLAKPVSRGAFVVGKWLGIIGLVSIYCVWTSAVLAGTLAFAGATEVPPSLIALAGAALGLKLSVSASVILFPAVVCRTGLLAGVLAFLMMAVCHLHPLLPALDRAADWTLMNAVAGFTRLAFPDFQLLDLSARVVTGDSVPWRETAAMATYGFVYSAAWLGLAVQGFRRREI